MITSLIVCRRCSVPAGSCRPPSPPNQTNAVNLRYAGMPAGPSQSLGKCRDRQVTRDDRRVHQQRNQHELQRLGRMPQQRESAGGKTAKGHRVAGSPVVPPYCRKEPDDHHAGDGHRFGHAHTTQRAHEFADARGGERVGAGDETGHHHAKPHGKQPDDMYPGVGARAGGRRGARSPPPCPASPRPTTIPTPAEPHSRPSAAVPYASVRQGTAA